MRFPYGRLELPSESATTVPTAAAAPMMMPMRIRIRRTRFCFDGAIAAPAGRDPATPVGLVTGPAAVPSGFCAWPA